MKKFMLLSAFILVAQQNLAVETNNDDSKENYQEIQLEKTIISESNFETNVATTPKNVTIVTSEEFQAKGAKSVAEAVKNVPGLNIKTIPGSEPTFDLRGQGDTASSNVLVLRDGVPLNSIDQSGPMTSNIPLDNIDRIEVIPGGGSVLYGDGAVGGVINIISKAPEDRKNYGSIGMEAGSYDLFKESVNYGTKINEKLFLTFDYSHQNLNGYRDFMKSDLTTFDTSGLYLLDDGKIDFRFSYAKTDFNAPGSLTRSQVEDDREQAADTGSQSDGDTENFSYDLNYSTKITENLEFLNFFSYSTKDYNSFSEQYYPPSYGYPGYWYSWNYDYNTEQLYIKPHLKYSYGDNNSVIFGIDHTNANSDITDGGMMAEGKREKESLGGFVSNRFYIDKLQLTQGFRYEETDVEYYETQTGDKADDSLNNHSFELTANYLYSKTGSVFINYISAFRTPNTDELALWEGDVKAQNSETYEIGTKDMIGNTFYSISVFYIKTDDEIMYDPDYTLNNGWGSNYNLDGETTRTGTELFLEHYFDKITLRESYSYIVPEITSGEYDGNELAGVPRTKITVGGTYQFNDKLKLNTDLRYFSDSYASGDFNNEGGRINSFTTVDISADYQIDDTLKIYGGINNLFDREYYDYVGYNSYDGTGYYPANGRNFFVGFKKSF